jgi:hypothetical protein
LRKNRNLLLYLDKKERVNDIKTEETIEKTKDSDKVLKKPCASDELREGDREGVTVILSALRLCPIGCVL